jgi:glutamine synthetase
MIDNKENRKVSGQAPPEELSTFLELLIPDMNGIPRGKTIEARSYDKDELHHLPASVFFQTLTGNYADVMPAYDEKDQDLLLNPDWSTYRRVPWRNDDHAQVICESLDKSGLRSDFDPRNVLKRILTRFSEEGLEPIIAPEVEFYLIKPVADPSQPIEIAQGVDHHTDFGGEALSIDALDKFSSFLDELRGMCTATDIQLAAIVHELGPAQIELNVAHGDALGRADQLFLLKRTVKACALRHNMTATFMAKPLADMPGSGLHLHSSLYKDSNNIFALNDGLAPVALKQFIGGLQQHLPDAFSLISPSINSYKRFVPDLCAPINLQWGYDNRTTGFRVPYGADKNGRVENRIAGADANPYLFIAAHLACGLLGLLNGIDASEPVEKDAYDMPADLPENLAQALGRLEASEALTKLFGKPFIDAFISVKRKQRHNTLGKEISWESRLI